MGELLLELLSEEIPARMQRRAIEGLVGLVRDKLATAEIAATSIAGHATPRRLAVIADGIPQRQPDRREERRGPRVGAPPQAIDGFLRAAGLQSIDQCDMRDTGRGEFYFAVLHHPGRPAAEVLPELLRAAIGELPWPKSMRFPAAGLRWVRPLNSAICLFDGAVLPLALDRVPVGRVTRGHRFLAPGEIALTDAADYRAKLDAACVILDHDRRRALIAAGLDAAATAEGLRLKDDPALLDEVTGLVEYPVVLMGRIDDASMELPPEVLATAMRTHQKYFSCLNSDGTPAPRFLFVANNKTHDDGRTIVAGNERVLRARLADARFFWDQDRKVRLADRVDALKQRVYYDKLGTMYDKAERIERLAGYLAEHLYPAGSPGDTPTPTLPRQRGREDTGAPIPSPAGGGSSSVVPSPTSGGGPSVVPSPAGGGGLGWGQAAFNGGNEVAQLAQRAARLAKADLSTGMVGEFPELQGVMGRYYALHDGEDPRIAAAIADHYKPQGPNDTCPTAPVSIAVALADKIDALAGFFTIGEAPTGSRDPFALRRAALGLIRLIVQNRLRLSLGQALSYADFSVLQQTAGGSVLSSVKDATLPFIAERLKVHLREEGARHDLLAAVFAVEKDDLLRLLARIDALSGFLGTEDGANLLIAYRRAVNIVAIEERRDRRVYAEPEDADLFNQIEEGALSRCLGSTGGRVGELVLREKFDEAMAALATLRGPVDEFFDKVTVNTDDRKLRENRLRLLSRIRAVMNQVADFSQIEG